MSPWKVGPLEGDLMGIAVPAHVARNLPVFPVFVETYLTTGTQEQKTPKEVEVSVHFPEGVFL